MSTAIYDEIFDFKLVAALDFGTTYSGYAYSFMEDPNAIFFPQSWYAGEGQLASLKTPTCLLLNPGAPSTPLDTPRKIDMCIWRPRTNTKTTISS